MKPLLIVAAFSSFMAASGTAASWILASGFWVDANVWVDAAVWID